MNERNKPNQIKLLSEEEFANNLLGQVEQPVNCLAICSKNCKFLEIEKTTAYAEGKVIENEVYCQNRDLCLNALYRAYIKRHKHQGNSDYKETE